MPAITIRNIPDEVHRGLKAQAARHGCSTEAEIRSILADAVVHVPRIRTGGALADIWGKIELTDEEVAAIATASGRERAKPLSIEQ